LTRDAGVWGLNVVARTIPAGLQVLPSLLSADFARLADEIQAVTAAGVAMLHLDVMDGHFVPNITFGPPLVRSIRRTTELFLDAHLMIADPLRYLEPFVDAGVDLLTLHAEALAGGRDERRVTAVGLQRFEEAAKLLARRQCGLGLTFRPGTDPRPWLEKVGSALDLVLIMTVEPGFGGQKFLAGELVRLDQVRRLAAQQGWRYRVEVDGGIGPDTAGACARAGAELFVAGQAVFGQADRARAIGKLRAAYGPPEASRGA